MDQRSASVAAWCGGSGGEEEDEEEGADTRLVGIDLSRQTAVVREGPEGRLAGRFLKRCVEEPSVDFENALRLAQRATAHPSSVNWATVTNDITRDIVALALGGFDGAGVKPSVVDQASLCQPEGVTARAPLRYVLQWREEEEEEEEASGGR